MILPIASQHFCFFCLIKRIDNLLIYTKFCIFFVQEKYIELQ